MSLSWIILNEVHSLGPVTISRLLARFGSPEDILKQSPSELGKSGIVSPDVAKTLKSSRLHARAEQVLERVSKCGARVLTLEDRNYPAVLKEIFAPPPVLYTRGSHAGLQRHAVGVVGTRKPTRYGEKAGATITSELTRHGLVIVSGLARGIDTIAHETCLAEKGTTTAVLGCGIDRIYPSENRDLAERIVSRGGCIVSEFAPGIFPEARNFPRRNRIISGLSSGVIVVEAGKKSGGLITANYAVQQSREVFAIPGSIFSNMSDGTFELLTQGATPIRTGRDVLENLQMPMLPRPISGMIPKATLPSPETLSAQEQLVLEKLTDTPLNPDGIADKTGHSPSDLFGVLLNLELKGFITQLAGQKYVRL